MIHTVGPVWQGGSHNESGLLARAYRESLKVAISHRLTTVDFPAISTGIYGYPIWDAAEVALGEVHRFLRNTSSSLSVTILLFDQHIFDIFNKVLRDKIENEE